MLESIIKSIAFSTGLVDLLRSCSYSMATTYQFALSNFCNSIMVGLKLTLRAMCDVYVLQQIRFGYGKLLDLTTC